MADVLEEKPITGIKPEKSDDDTAFLDGLLADKEPEIDIEEKEDEEEKPEENLLQEPDEPEELIDTNARALDLKKIKEKYPDFAKTNEFRELRNAYHREAQYTELFPTIEDAKEAAENNETFNTLNNDLVNRGDATSLVNAIKDANPTSLKKLSSTFLDTIAKVDNNLYIEAVTPVIKKLIGQIRAESQKYLKRNPESEDGKALEWTAKNLMQYCEFDNTDTEPKIDPQITEKEKELSQREQNIRQQNFSQAYSICASSVEKHLDKSILEGLDPNGKFNDFTRDTLLEKIKNEVKSQIDKDSLHGRRMSSLWKRAESEGFSRESLSRIVSAYLERARPIIPTVRNRFRTIAVKGKQQLDNEEQEEKPLKIANRGRSGRAPSNDGKVNIRQVDVKKIDYRNTSDDDIFEGKVSLKK